MLVCAAAGVLEAVRISCAGFPSKRPFPDFADHFWTLAPELYHREDVDDRWGLRTQTECVFKRLFASLL